MRAACRRGEAPRAHPTGCAHPDALADLAPPSATNGDRGRNGERDVDDEYPAPGILPRRDLHQQGPPERPQDPSQRIDGADETQRGGPPAGRQKVADHGHRHRQQGAAARALDSPPRDHAWQIAGECADDRSDEKECQRALEGQRPAHDVGEPPDDRNGHDVGEEIAVDDPDVAVDVGGIDPQVGHHSGQDRGDDGEIESAEEDRQQRGAQCTTVGRVSGPSPLRPARPAARSRCLRHDGRGSASTRRGSAAPVPAAPTDAPAAGHASPDRSRGRPSPVTR